MNQPLVSVIIPVYNVQDYLGECLESVCRQTYSRLEVILVEDGSRDASGAIRDAWARRDARIRVIHKANAGPSVARNVGLAAARGEFVTFVDSDDVLAVDFTRVLMELQAETSSDIAIGGYSTKRLGEAPAPSSAVVTTMSSAEALGALGGPDHVGLTVVWGKIYRFELFEGIEFPPGRAFEDQFVSYRVLAAANTVAATRRTLYYYRQRSDSIMAAPYNPIAETDAIHAYVEQSEFFTARGMPGQARRTFSRAFGKYLRVAHATSLGTAQGIQGQIVSKDVVPQLKQALRLLNVFPLRRLYYSACLASPAFAGLLYRRRRHRSPFDPSSSPKGMSW